MVRGQVKPNRDTRRQVESEGPACRVRCITLDYLFHFSGHDKRAPPILLITSLTSPTYADTLIHFVHVVCQRTI